MYLNYSFYSQACYWPFLHMTYFWWRSLSPSKSLAQNVGGVNTYYFSSFGKPIFPVSQSKGFKRGWSKPQLLWWAYDLNWAIENHTLLSDCNIYKDSPFWWRLSSFSDNVILEARIHVHHHKFGTCQIWNLAWRWSQYEKVDLRNC